ncbi:hypothetical protein [Priestia sp. TGN 0903]|uniref:hypothetical protein n=1 Tax=Priestia sp. TGN 0903 TaxID=3420730 RepID=UPI003D77A4B0
MRIGFFDYLNQRFKDKIDCLFITEDITHQGQEYTEEEEVYEFLNEILALLLFIPIKVVKAS